MRRCKILYSTTKISLRVASWSALSYAAISAFHSILLLADAEFELHILIYAKAKWFCLSLLSLTTIFSELPIGTMCVVAMERFVVLCDPYSRQKSVLATGIGLTLLFIRTLCFASAYFSQLPKPEQIDFCDQPLFWASTTTIRIVMFVSHALQMFALCIMLYLIHRKAKVLKESYCINHALMPISTRLTLERSVKIANVMTMSMLIGSLFYPVIGMWAVIGPSVIQAETSTKRILSLVCFCMPAEIVHALDALNDLRLLKINNAKKTKSTSLRMLSRSGPGEFEIGEEQETEIRFAALNKSWSERRGVK